MQLISRKIHKLKPCFDTEVYNKKEWRLLWEAKLRTISCVLKFYKISNSYCKVHGITGRLLSLPSLPHFWSYPLFKWNYRGCYAAHRNV